MIELVFELAKVSVGILLGAYAAPLLLLSVEGRARRRRTSRDCECGKGAVLEKDEALGEAEDDKGQYELEEREEWESHGLGCGSGCNLIAMTALCFNANNAKYGNRSRKVCVALEEASLLHAASSVH